MPALPVAELAAMTSTATGSRPKHRVFVYGTLKRGQPNFFHFQSKDNGRAQFVGKAQTEEAFPLIVATKFNLPFLLYASGKGHIVQGEVYDVDDQMFEFLDDFEGHPEVYQRDKVKVLVKLTEENRDKENVQPGLQNGDHLVLSDQECLRKTTEQITTPQHGEIENVTNTVSTVENSTSESSLHERNGDCMDDVEELATSLLGATLKGNETNCRKEECWTYFLKRFPSQLLENKSTADYDAYSCHQKKYVPEEDLSGPDNIYEALLEECQ